MTKPALVLLFALAACGGGGLSLNKSDGGSPDGGTGCSDHKDRASCGADSACEAVSCCPDDQIVGCFPKGQGPVIECFDGCPSGCAAHKTEPDCAADTACTSVTWENPAADCAGPSSCAELVECVDRGAPCSPNDPQGMNCSKPVACGSDQDYYVENGCAVGCISSAQCSLPLD